MLAVALDYLMQWQNLLPKEFHLDTCTGDLNNVLDGAGETLVLLGIVVLQTDLQLHGFQEATLLLGGGVQEAINTLIQGIARNFRSAG